MSADDRTILQSNLGNLLGFDDGVADILDHLLSIESREDLLEYLSQLLGDVTPEIVKFVDNVGRFQKGEPLVVDGDENKSEIEDSKPPAKKSAPKSTPSNNNNNNNQQQQQKQQTKGDGPTKARNNQKKNKSRVPPPQKKMQQAKQGEPAKKQAPEAKNSSQTAKAKEEQVRPPIKSQPPKGKAKIVCGCFGTKHKALTNCLYCGRISCVKEGYDFCGFCGYLVEEVRDGVHDGDEAWVQKERLLRFDREFARRTQIFDDQADFQGPDRWMNDEELKQAEEARNKRLEAMKRPKQTLQLNIS